MGKFTKKKMMKTVCLFLACTCVFGAFAGCKEEESSTSAVQNYDGTAGIQFDEEITGLVEDGKSDYKIVVPAAASECETYAASQMQYYVKQSTGAELPIVKDDTGVTLGQPLLSVGDTKLAESLEAKALNTDGFRIKTESETVLIKGEIDRGTLYGVYDFLEKFLGVRFLTADYEYVPEHEDVALYEMDITEIPDIRIRSHYVLENDRDPAFNAKRRMQSMVTPRGSADKYGGGFRDEWTSDMHAYAAIANKNTYGEAHPEWYTKMGYDSHVAGSGWNWELSNGLTDEGTIDESMETSLLKTVIENVKQMLIEQPTAKYVAFGQEDNLNYCRGDNCGGKCVRQREQFGGHSAHAIVFANAVSKAIDEWLEAEGMDREVYFVLYAYQFTLSAPDLTAPRADLAVPRDNLYFMICPYGGSNYNAPLSDKEKNSYFSGIITSWQRVTKQMMIFDYGVNWDDPLTWYVNMGVLKPNLQWYKEIGAIANFNNCHVSNGYQGDLRDYLLQKLMWNANRDVNALVSEFNKMYFGEAAGKIMDEYVGYNNAHFEKVANSGTAWKAGTLWTNGEGSWMCAETTLTVDYLRGAQRLLDLASAAIEADEAASEQLKEQYRKHMIAAQVQVDYMKYLNYKALFSTTEEKDKAFYQAFYDRLKIMGYTQFDSSTVIDDVFSAMGIY